MQRQDAEVVWPPENNVRPTPTVHEQAICRYLHGLPLCRLDNAPLSHACPNVTRPNECITCYGIYFHNFRSVASTLYIYKWPHQGWGRCFEMYVTPLCRTLWRKVRVKTCLNRSPYLDRFNINDHPRGLDVLWFGDFTITIFRSVTFAGVGATICTTAIIYISRCYATLHVAWTIPRGGCVCVPPCVLTSLCTYLLPLPALRTLHVLNYFSFLWQIHKPAEGRCFLLRNHFLVYLSTYIKIKLEKVTHSLT